MIPVENEGQVNRQKSNLVPRLEELVEGDLRHLPRILKKNKRNVCQPREVSQLEKLAEEVTAVTSSPIREKQRKSYVLQVQKGKDQPVVRKVLEELRQRRHRGQLREPVKLTCLILKKKVHKSRGEKTAKVQKEKQESSRLLDKVVVFEEKQQGFKEQWKGPFLRLLRTNLNTMSINDESVQLELQQEQAGREYRNTSKNNRKKNVKDLRNPMTQQRSTLETEEKQGSPQRSESQESHDSEEIRKDMVKRLTSERSKTTKQTAVKASSPAKSSTRRKTQPPKQTVSKKSVQVTREGSVTDPEDNQTLASLQEKRTKEKGLKRPGQKKDRNEVEKKQPRVEVHSHSEEEMFVTRKMPTAEDSQMSPTHKSHGEEEEMSEIDDEKE